MMPRHCTVLMCLSGPFWPTPGTSCPSKELLTSRNPPRQGQLQTLSWAEAAPPPTGNGPKMPPWSPSDLLCVVLQSIWEKDPLQASKVVAARLLRWVYPLVVDAKVKSPRLQLSRCPLSPKR